MVQLLPKPLKMVDHKRRVRFSDGGHFSIRPSLPPSEWHPAAKFFESAFTHCSDTGIEVRWDVDASLPEQAYRLQLDESGIGIAAHSSSGAFYALQSLRQIFRQCPSGDLPALEIEDAPALATRGYMLDISRDRVPRIDWLKSRIAELAALKLNQLQLYSEHCFTYKGHETVWAMASAYTPDDIREIDALCRDHHIELVPCVNTLGHCERWLQHPQYHRFAESPFGWRAPNGLGMEHGSTLYPSPESLQLTEELLTEYLSCFASYTVNIGGDEPWELGTGRSRAVAEKKGQLTVYGDWMHSVVQAAQKLKPKVQMWSDVAVENPATLGPRFASITWNVWGYESGHPFQEQIDALRLTKAPLQLCPGTSTWNSLGTRLENALQNICEAVTAARKNEITALLLTDWGDNGHHQPACLSLPAIACFAALSWNPDGPVEALAPALELAFGIPPATGLAEIWESIGRIDASLSQRMGNRNVLAIALRTPQNELDSLYDRISASELESIETRLKQALDRLGSEKDQTAPVSAAIRQTRWTLRALLHASQRLLDLHRNDRQHREQRDREMRLLIGEFEALWLETSRVGGLYESSQRLRQTLSR